MEPGSGIPRVAPSPLAPAAGLEDGFGAGKVIGHTFSAWRRHALAFSVLTLVADAPIFLVSALGGLPGGGLAARGTNPLALPATAAAPPPFWRLAYLASMLLFVVEIGAITQGVIRHLAGRPVSLGAMVATGLRRALPLLVVGLLCYLVISAGLVLFIAPGLYLACALAVAVPAVVVERPGILGALRRSFALTKGRRLAIFAAFLVLFAAAFGVAVVAGFVLPLLTASFAPMLGTLLGLAVNVVFGTVLWVAPGVVYHDLRVAKEGVDTAQLAAIFE